MHNIDPRSKLCRPNKNGQVTTNATTPLTVPNVVIVVVMGESSSFSGQKFDGYAYLPNAAALDAFRKHVGKSKSREEYSYIVDVGLRAISDLGLEIMSTKISENPERPWLWVDTDYSVKLWS